MSFDIDPADERSELDMCIAEIHRQKEQITALQARNEKLEKFLKVTKQVASINLTNPKAAWVSDLVQAIKEAEGE
jgi:hypothetical protein